MPAAIIATLMNKINSFMVMFGKIFDIATTAPFLARSSKYNVMKLNTKFTVLIPPIIIKKPLEPIFPTMLLLIIAACDDPIAGRVDTKPPEKTEAGIVLNIVFLSIFGEVMICSGIFVFEFRLITKVEIPNNPEKSGQKAIQPF